MSQDATTSAKKKKKQTIQCRESVLQKHNLTNKINHLVDRKIVATGGNWNTLKLPKPVNVSIISYLEVKI